MSQQPYKIIEETFDIDLKKRIYEGFSEHALASVGSDSNMEDITFIARDSGIFLGAVHGKTFWGALHIKYLYVTPEARRNGIGKALMHRAFKKGILMGCRFAFIETMSFQAVDFYKNLGFIEEYVRSGYDKGTSFHYMRKDFHA
ncbi:MAG: GNAT family N-acetyltransferase [Chlamydiales bacterium]|nr:GNAT family N-acetyltransferase [Chlamydiales bacterium]